MLTLNFLEALAFKNLNPHILTRSWPGSWFALVNPQNFAKTSVGFSQIFPVSSPPRLPRSKEFEKMLLAIRLTVSTSHFWKPWALCCKSQIHDLCNFRLRNPDLGTRKFWYRIVGHSCFENLNRHYFNLVWSIILIDFVNPEKCVKTCRIFPFRLHHRPDCPRSKGSTRRTLLVIRLTYKPFPPGICQL